MTCSGIDGDDDFIPFILPPIPIEDPKEIQNSTAKVLWNGRVVTVLNTKENTIQSAQSAIERLSHITQDTPNADFFQRLIEVLAFGVFDETEEEAEREWDFAPVQEILSAQITEDMTLEQFLEQTGMVFDRETGQYIECKNWFMKKLHQGEKLLRKTGKQIDKKRRQFFHAVDKGAREGVHIVEKGAREVIHVVEKGAREGVHIVEKAVRHTYKDVEEFVKEHKTEVAIAAAVVVVVVAYLTVPVIAATINTAALAAFPFLDNKKEDEERSFAASLLNQSASSPSGPDPHPSIPAGEFMQQLFGDLLPTSTPASNSGIYPIDAEQRQARDNQSVPSIEAHRPNYTPPSPNDNFVHQFYDRLFQGNPDLNPYKNSGKTPTAQTDCAIAPETSGSLPSASSSSPPPMSSAPETSNGFTRFLESLRQGLETIGRMSGPEVDSDLFDQQQGTPTNSDSASDSTPPSSENAPALSADAFKSNFGAYLKNLYHDLIAASSQGQVAQNETVSGDVSQTPSTETPESTNNFTRLLQTLRQGIETIGRMSGPEVDSDLFDQQQVVPSRISASESTGEPIQSSGLMNLVETMRQDLETMGKIHEPKSSIPDTIFNKIHVPSIHPSQPDTETDAVKKSSPIFVPYKKVQDPENHITIPSESMFSLIQPQNMKVLPVISPQGEINWLLITGNLDQFQFTPEEIESGAIFLESHLKDVMPKTGDSIAYVTVQNGINTSKGEFYVTCTEDMKKIAAAALANAHHATPNLPFLVGAYNPTNGVPQDVSETIQDIKGQSIGDMACNALGKIFQGALDTGLISELLPDIAENVHKFIGQREPTPIVKSTGRILGVLGTTAKEINAAFTWLHVTHSRAGAIVNRIIETNPNVGKLMKQHMLSVSLGPALPISRDKAILAINFCSQKDYVVKWFALPYKNDPNYDIRFLECISDREDFSFYLADHARLGKTYDTAFEKAIEELTSKWGFNNEAKLE